MNNAYPLFFTPIPREKEFWGGNRFVQMLHKEFDPEKKIGESWELADYQGFESVVTNGAFAGKSIRELIQQFPQQIVGAKSIMPGGRFPLLVKFIDAAETLSVQVHPDDAYASQNEKSFGKKEAWYILHAEVGSKIIRGVTQNTSREKLSKAIESCSLDDCLHAFDPEAGDIVMIPWGMVHSIGAGILLLEIQQTSDLTYRVYDWGRTDDQGGSRVLNVDKAMDVIKFEPPINDTEPRRLVQKTPTCNKYEAVHCDKFEIQVLELDGRIDDTHPHDRFVILNVVSGDAAIEYGDGEALPMPLGSTCLVPAALTKYALSGKATILRTIVP